MQANPNHGTCDRTALHGRGAAISPERYPCLAHALIAVLLRVQQSMTYALSMHTVALHIPMCNVLMVRCDQAPFMLHCHTILCCTSASPCCVCVMHDPCHVSIVRCIMLAPSWCATVLVHPLTQCINCCGAASVLTRAELLTRTIRIRIPLSPVVLQRSVKTWGCPRCAGATAMATCIPSPDNKKRLRNRAKR